MGGGLHTVGSPLVTTKFERLKDLESKLRAVFRPWERKGKRPWRVGYDTRTKNWSSRWIAIVGLAGKRKAIWKVGYYLWNVEKLGEEPGRFSLLPGHG